MRTIRIFLEKPKFLAGNANWISELPSVIKRNNNTMHSLIKMTPNQASKKSNEKLVFSNLQDRGVKQQLRNKLGQLLRTADLKKVFSKGESTNYSYNLYTKTEAIHGTIPAYRINNLPDRYNENILLPTKLTLDENNKVVIKLNLIQ